MVTASPPHALNSSLMLWLLHDDALLYRFRDTMPMENYTEVSDRTLNNNRILFFVLFSITPLHYSPLSFQTETQHADNVGRSDRSLTLNWLVVVEQCSAVELFEHFNNTYRTVIRMFIDAVAQQLPSRCHRHSQKRNIQLWLFRSG